MNAKQWNIDAIFRPRPSALGARALAGATALVLTALVAVPTQAATTKPATSKPATSKPATSKPATSKPATSKPATSKPATGGSSKSTTATKSTARPVSGPSWRVIDDPAFLEGQNGPLATVYTGVGASGARPWTLAGVWQDRANAAPKPTVWTSRNARDWTRQTLPMPAGATGGQVQGMVSQKGSAIAVGTIWRGSDAEPGIWTSGNRTSWDLFAGGVSVSGQQTLADVATTEDGFIAVGNEIVGGRAFPYIVRGSRNKLTRISGRAFPRAEEPFRNIQDVTSDGQQRVVVIANVGASGSTRGHAWTSVDGGRTFVNGRDFPTAPLDYGKRYPGVDKTQTPATVSAVSWIEDPVDNTRNQFVALGQAYATGNDAASSQLVSWSSNDGAKWRLYGPDFNIDIETNAGFGNNGMVPFDFTPAGGDSYSGIVSMLDAGRGNRPMLAMMPIRQSGFVSRPIDLPDTVVGATPGPMLWGSLERVSGVLTVSNGSGRPQVNFFDTAAEAFLPKTPKEEKEFPDPQPRRSVTVVGGTGKTRRYLGIDFPIPAESSAGDARTQRPVAVGRALTWAPRPGNPGRLRFATPLVDDDSTPRSMVVVGDKTYVVGQKPGTDRYDGAMWTLEDDGNLVEVKTTGLGGEGAQVILGGAKGTKGWYVVGTQGSADGNNDAVVWTSTNGLTWERATSDLFGGDGNQVATSVCTLPDGRAVVGGYVTGSANGGEVPVAWYENELGEWDGTLLSRNDGYAADCSSTPRGVVVVGIEGDRAGVWKTDDGATYTPFELPDQGPGFVAITAVASSSKGTVLVGQVDDGAGTKDIAVWVAPSAKGDAIRRLSSPSSFTGWGEQYVKQIRLNGDTAVMVGSDGAAARVWETANIFKK